MENEKMVLPLLNIIKLNLVNKINSEDATWALSLEENGIAE